jgi:hypothetical protein
MPRPIPQLRPLLRPWLHPGLRLLPVLALLAACAARAPEPDPLAAVPPDAVDVTPGLTEQEPDTCKAAELAGLIGQPSAAVATAGITRPTRIVPAGGLVSQDYDAGRVNLYLDSAGSIVRIACG